MTMFIDPIVLSTDGVITPPLDPIDNRPVTSQMIAQASETFYDIFDDRLTSDGGSAHGAVIYYPDDIPIRTVTEEEIFDTMLAIFAIDELDE